MIFKRKLRPSVFIVTYYLDKNNLPFYLIQKRKKHWKGYEFPKGGIDAFETKRQAVRREIKEEVGLEIIQLKNHHKKGKWIYEKELKDRPGLIGQSWSLFSVQVRKGKLHVDKKEHFSQEWLSYQEALKKLTYSNQKECLKIVHKFLTN